MSQSAAVEQAVVSAPAPRETSRGRTVLAVVIFVIAALLAPMAFVGAWAGRTISDTDRYVATVSPLLQSEQVRNEITTQITDQLFASVPVSDIVGQILPPNAQALSGPIESGLRSFVTSQVKDLLATPQAQQAWDTVNAELQSRLVAVLKGDNSGSVTVQGDTLVLDTGVLFQKVKDLLVARGFTIFAKVPLPAQANRQFVLLKSTQIKTVSTIYRIAEPLANSLIWVVLGLLVLGIFVSNKRRLGVLTAGWILIVVGALIIAAVTVLRAAFLADLGVSDSSWQAVTFDTVIRFLLGLGRTALAVGIIGVLAAVLSGPSKAAVALRAFVMRMAAATARPLREAVPSVTGFGKFVRSSLAIIGAVIVALAVVALLWGRTASAGRAFWIVVIGLIVWFVVLVLAATADGGGDGADAASADAAEAPVSVGAADTAASATNEAEAVDESPPGDAPA